MGMGAGYWNTLNLEKPSDTTEWLGNIYGVTFSHMVLLIWKPHIISNLIQYPLPYNWHNCKDSSYYPAPRYMKRSWVCILSTFNMIYAIRENRLAMPMLISSIVFCRIYIRIFMYSWRALFQKYYLWTWHWHCKLYFWIDAYCILE